MPERVTGGLLGNARFFAVLHHEFANPPLGNRLTLVIEKRPGCDAVRSYREIALEGVNAFFVQSDLSLDTPFPPYFYRGLDKIDIRNSEVGYLRYSDARLQKHL